jgi:hypothetical protein
MSLPLLNTFHTADAMDKEPRDVSLGGVSRTPSENSLELISAYVGPAVRVGVKHVFFLLLLNAAAADSAAAIAACVEGDHTTTLRLN